MPDLYEFKVDLVGTEEKVEFGLSSVDTGAVNRLFKMFTIQTRPLVIYEEEAL